MSKLLVLANEATAAQRRVYFHLVDATDGITPETGEAGGQPQVSSDGGAWTNTGIGTLSAIGNGRYYADLTQTLVQTAGTQIETRFKSANTAECPGDSVQVVAFDPNDAVRLGLTALPNAAADAAGGLPISDAGGLDLDVQLATLTNGTYGLSALKTLIDAVDNFIDTEIAAIVAAIGTPSNLGSGATLAANLVDIESQTDDIGTAGAGLTAIPSLTSALTESYRAHGATGTMAQLLYEILAGVANSSISGTTKTAKNIAGTAAKTYTLDSATAPTSISYAS